MDRLVKRLLGGAALGALVAGPCAASAGVAFHITALHNGRLVNKTILREPGAWSVNESAPVDTTIPSSDLHERVKLVNTYYKWSSSGDICTQPKQRVKLDAKKTAYAKLGTSTMTYSYGCPSGPTVLYGDTYRLTKLHSKGPPDSFFSHLIGKFRIDGHKYRGDEDLHVTVYVVR